MTYCVAVLLESGMVFAPGFAHEMRGLMISPALEDDGVLERAGDRVLCCSAPAVWLGTQAVIGLLRSARRSRRWPGTVWDGATMFDVMGLLSAAVRLGQHLNGPTWRDRAADSMRPFSGGRPLRASRPGLFRMYAEGNFIEA